MDCKPLVTARTGISFLLLVNLSTAIFVICWVTNSPKNETIQQQDSFQTSLEKAIAITETSNLHSVLERGTKHETKSLPLELLNLLKPIFHQTGLNFNRRANKHKQFPVRSWAVTNGTEENQMHNGFRYENGWVIVPALGLYCVYSHVTFYAEDNNLQDEKQTDIFHGIYRYNAATMVEETLLLNKVTRCNKHCNDRIPSDIRTIVELNAGDHLIVKVSNRSMLNHNRDWHYVGIYLV